MNDFGQKRELRTGDYVLNRGADTPAERADCKRVMRANGCRTVRFEPREGLLFVHGYLAAIEGHQEFETL